MSGVEADPKAEAWADFRAQVLHKQMQVPEWGIGAEIGVFKGQFTKNLLRVVRPAKIHLIDPWYVHQPEWDWADGNKSTIDALAGILHEYAAELISGQCVLNIGDDMEILPTFPDGYFDWVYLDTSHLYEHSVKELEILKTKVKPEGLIAGDDLYEESDNPHHGLYVAVHEFVEREPYEWVYASTEDKQWAIRRTDV